MKTILIAASDTGAGKTRVCGALAGTFSAYGLAVQIVKAVQTGVAEGARGDAETAAEGARSLAALFANPNAGRVSAHTLFSFAAPLAPLAAAGRERREFGLRALADALAALPGDGADIRIVETAGGLAVPVDADGSDWADFARDIAADLTVLVVDDRLGAINQGRLVAAYAKSKNVPAPGFWLNAVSEVSPDVKQSNRLGLVSSGLRLLADTAHGEFAPRLPSGSPLTTFFTA